MQDKIKANNIKKLIGERLIAANPQTKNELETLKRKIAKDLKIPFPDNIFLLSALNLQRPDLYKICKSGRGRTSAKFGRLKELLRTRPVRSLSGIVNVSVLTKPYPCPGNCLYCPNEPGFPKSYLSGEPAAERARFLKFNPYIQVKKRLENLKIEGHNIDKIELRVIGGTWSFYPKSYQEKFITACFTACNNLNNRRGGPTPAIHALLRGSDPRKNTLSLKREQKRNENAKCRIVGISIETRPDYINEKEIIRLRELGVTRVELGVQSVFNDVLELNCRGHKIDDTINATKLLKNAGFKVSYQIMLNLYGSSPERDLEMAKILFSNPDFCPDLLKIYPCAVLKEAPLYRLYEQKKYRPYSDQKLIEAVKEIKKITPPWIRIERIIRDIPSPRITAGAKEISNLRQIIAKDMEREDWTCQCIRCREIKGEYDPNEKIFLTRRDYPASDGLEVFLSFENENKTKLFSLLRLRIPNKKPEIRANNHSPLRNTKHRLSIQDAGLIREIHTYGLQTNIGQKGFSAQHTGLGKKLILEAEKIARTEFNLKKIAAISGVGARAYWRKNGYKLQKTYMVKKIGKD
jgi:elongator complex protein 3